MDKPQLKSSWPKMIGHYATGIFPRTEELIEATMAYERGWIGEGKLGKAFEKGTSEVISAQLASGLCYVSDGMLKWQDLFRPFTENLSGVKAGSLERWFNNNMFYRKPIIVDEMWREKSIVKKALCIKCLPKRLPWKAVLPAPYTFVQLSENRFYKSKTEFMFKYAEILREEIRDLAKLGFKYIQLSDPALVFEPTTPSLSKDALAAVKETLKVATKGIHVKTSLQTFFGDFSKILPEALEFPVEHLGIDMYETDFERLKEHDFQKGVALGLVDSRSSLVENADGLVRIAREIIASLYPSGLKDVFVCPNCDLEFLPWKRAKEKLHILSEVTEGLREEFYG